MTTVEIAKKNNKRYMVLFIINTLINILLLTGLLIILGSLQQIYGKILKIEREHVAYSDNSTKEVVKKDQLVREVDKKPKKPMEKTSEKITEKITEKHTETPIVSPSD